MRAIAWKRWSAEERPEESRLFCRCQAPGCKPLRRYWQGLQWWCSGLRLHDSWCCSPQCFESAARDCFARACAEDTNDTPARPMHHRIPLGLLMLSRGVLTDRQLGQALEAQQGDRGRRIGEWLEKLGFADEEQVTTALALQWACPVVSSFGTIDPDCGRIIPYPLLESCRIMPMRYVAPSQTFYLAFDDGINYRALHAIEQIVKCRTEACLVSRSTMQRALEQLRHQRGPGDFLFDGWRDPADMARVTLNYALRFGAETARMVTCGNHIWVRLDCPPESINLLFRLPRTAFVSDAHNPGR